jgi:hypothetical protein
VTGPLGLEAILVDSSDTLGDAQILSARNKLAAELTDLPVGWALQAWKVTASEQSVPEPLAPLVCKPEREPSSVTGNIRDAERRYREFERLALGWLDIALEAKPESASPILEAIQGIALRYLGRPEFRSVENRRIVIVSDLIQNTSSVSLVSALVPFEQVRQSKSFEGIRADITRVRVTVYYLSRRNGPNRVPLIQWWERLFRESGAVLERVERIAG